MCRRYFDIPGRLVVIRSDRTNGNSVVAQISTHGYKLDALGRWTRNTFHDGSYWEYGYNDRSEVTSATRKTPAGTVIPQLAASYAYDGIGNRLSSTSPIPGNHTYTPNFLNQYASITTSNSRTAIGRAPAAWVVEVDGTAATRTGELYHRAITASNGVSPVWKDVVTRRDTGTPSTTGHFWYAATPFTPVHDSDGNLTNDGRWSYVWSAENRLIQMESTPQAVTAGHPYTKVVNAYDWQGHRIAKHVWQGGTAASPVFSSSTRWLYNGWNEIAEFSASSITATTLTREKTFTWGLDLSGSLQGAGGVGGLLVQTTVASGVKEAASYDGNGNIVAWTKSTASAPTAQREYDAFGNTVVSEGAWPSSFGFSTKRQDAETGLYYYGYRFYDPVTGRWHSRDPIEERGGFNLYGFVHNNSISNWDYLGKRVDSLKVYGSSTLQSGLKDSIWYDSFGDTEFGQLLLNEPRGTLGGRTGIHENPTQLWPFNNKHLVMGFKFEAKANWCIGKELPKWTSNLGWFRMYFVKNDGSIEVVNSNTRWSGNPQDYNWVDFKSDGPSGQYFDRTGKKDGDTVPVFMYDMPRMSIYYKDAGKYRSFHLEGTWQIQVEADGSKGNPTGSKHLQIKLGVEIPSGDINENWALDVTPN